MVNRKLRVLRTVLQVETVWDDGDDLAPGPAIDPVALPLSALPDFIASLPDEISKLAEQLSDSACPGGDATGWQGNGGDEICVVTT